MCPAYAFHLYRVSAVCLVAMYRAMFCIRRRYGHIAIQNARYSSEGLAINQVERQPARKNMQKELES
jgi:hypothetical protein